MSGCRLVCQVADYCALPFVLSTPLFNITPGCLHFNPQALSNVVVSRHERFTQQQLALLMSSLSRMRQRNPASPLPEQAAVTASSGSNSSNSAQASGQAL